MHRDSKSSIVNITNITSETRTAPFSASSLSVNEFPLPSLSLKDINRSLLTQGRNVTQKPLTIAELQSTSLSSSPSTPTIAVPPQSSSSSSSLSNSSDTTPIDSPHGQNRRGSAVKRSLFKLPEESKDEEEFSVHISGHISDEKTPDSSREGSISSNLSTHHHHRRVPSTQFETPKKTRSISVSSKESSSPTNYSHEKNTQRTQTHSHVSAPVPTMNSQHYSDHSWTPGLESIFATLQSSLAETFNVNLVAVDKKFVSLRSQLLQQLSVHLSKVKKDLVAEGRQLHKVIMKDEEERIKKTREESEWREKERSARKIRDDEIDDEVGEIQEVQRETLRRIHQLSELVEERHVDTEEHNDLIQSANKMTVIEIEQLKREIAALQSAAAVHIKQMTLMQEKVEQIGQQTQTQSQYNKNISRKKASDDEEEENVENSLTIRKSGSSLPILTSRITSLEQQYTTQNSQLSSQYAQLSASVSSIRNTISTQIAASLTPIKQEVVNIRREADEWSSIQRRMLLAEDTLSKINAKVEEESLNKRLQSDQQCNENSMISLSKFLADKNEAKDHWYEQYERKLKSREDALVFAERNYAWKEEQEELSKRLAHEMEKNNRELLQKMEKEMKENLIENGWRNDKMKSQTVLPGENKQKEEEEQKLKCKISELEKQMKEGLKEREDMKKNFQAQTEEWKKIKADLLNTKMNQSNNSTPSISISTVAQPKPLQSPTTTKPSTPIATAVKPANIVTTPAKSIVSSISSSMTPVSSIEKERQRKEEEESKKSREDDLKKKVEEEKKRVEELKKKLLEDEKMKKEEEQKKQTDQEMKKKKDAEEKRKRELELIRKAEEEKKKIEEVKIKLLEDEKLKKETEERKRSNLNSDISSMTPTGTTQLSSVLSNISSTPTSPNEALELHISCRNLPVASRLLNRTRVLISLTPADSNNSQTINLKITEKLNVPPTLTGDYDAEKTFLLSPVTVLMPLLTSPASAFSACPLRLSVFESEKSSGSPVAIDDLVGSVECSVGSLWQRKGQNVHFTLTSSHSWMTEQMQMKNTTVFIKIQKSTVPLISNPMNNTTTSINNNMPYGKNSIATISETIKPTNQPVFTPVQVSTIVKPNVSSFFNNSSATPTSASSNTSSSLSSLAPFQSTSATPSKHTTFGPSPSSASPITSSADTGKYVSAESPVVALKSMENATKERSAGASAAGQSGGISRMLQNFKDQINSESDYSDDETEVESKVNSNNITTEILATPAIKDSNKESSKTSIPNPKIEEKPDNLLPKSTVEKINTLSNTYSTQTSSINTNTNETNKQVSSTNIPTNTTSLTNPTISSPSLNPDQKEGSGISKYIGLKTTTSGQSGMTPLASTLGPNKTSGIISADSDSSSEDDTDTVHRFNRRAPSDDADDLMVEADYDDALDDNCEIEISIEGNSEDQNELDDDFH